MKSPKKEKIFPILVSNPQNHMESFAQNIRLMKKYKGYSAEKLAEISDVSPDTLKNLLSGKGSDCKLSTAIKIAKSLEIGLDPLIGSETMVSVNSARLDIIRRLPKHEYNMLMFYIDRLGRIMSKDCGELPKEINVLNPMCLNGTLKWTNEWEKVNIEMFDNDIRCKCLMALRVPCVHYMPVYSNGDILLLANDRQPINGEHCVIDINGFMYITRCVRIGGKYTLKSIINDNVKACDADSDRIIGYVASVVRENGENIERI